MITRAGRRCFEHSGCFCAAEEAWSENVGGWRDQLPSHDPVTPVTTAKFYPKPGRLGSASGPELSRDCAIVFSQTSIGAEVTYWLFQAKLSPSVGEVPWAAQSRHGV